MGRLHRKRNKSPEPQDVLAGRIELKPAELVELIRRVNPTGRELDAEEEAKRYRQKAGLQSLLIRRHGDERLVVTPAGDEGVVGLTYGVAQDACHAVVDELDADARAWIWRRLDLAAVERVAVTEDDVAVGALRRPAAPAAGPAESPEELLTAAEEALAEYDYDLAERRLRQAFDTSGGTLSTSRALLAFLADHLGQDDAVLALEGQLSPAAAEHPDLRTILALAAARRGDTDAALRHAAGIGEHPRLAEVEVALATAALGRGAVEAAFRYRDAVAARDPGHPRLATLDRGLAELRLRGRQAVEEDLQRRYRAEGAQAVETAARELLAEWGESDLARRILRELTAVRHEQQVAEHLEQGENALAGERFAEAVLHFQAALDAGCEDHHLPERIARLREQARRNADGERLAAVVARFPSPPEAADTTDAGPYLAYLDLPAHLRRRARQALGSPRLELLEEALPAESLSGAKAQALLAAVLALERARAALESGEPAAALDELAPHRNALRALDKAHQLEEEARVRLAAARRDAAVALLDAAGDALSAGELEAARQALDGLAPSGLDDDARRRAETLRRRLDRAETAERLEREAAQHEAAGDLVGALERTRQLAAGTDGVDVRRRWRERSTALEDRLRQAWRVEVSEVATPLAEQCDFVPDPVLLSGPGVWLDDEGEELVVTSAWGEELFVRCVDVASRTVRRQISLRLPCAVHRPQTVRDGDRLLLAAPPGVYLELGLADARILTWRRLDEVVPSDFRVATARPLPGGRFLWLGHDVSKQVERILVIDTKTFRGVQERMARGHTVLLGEEGPRVFCKHSAGGRIYSERGTLVARVEGGEHTGFAASGRGDELFLSLMRFPADVARAGREAVANLDGDGPEAPEDGRADEIDLPEEDDEMEVCLIRMDRHPGGKWMICTSAESLPADSDGAHAMACDQAAGLAFALVVTPDDERELWAFNVAGEHFHSIYNVKAPFESWLVQDRRARHVAVLSSHGGSLTLRPLGSEPPSWEDVAPMDDPPRPEKWGPSESFGRQLLGAVRTADAAIRAGDPEAARQAIDRPIVWREEELQSAARLAGVYLDLPAATPGERFRKRLALAFFRHVWSRDEGRDRRELPLPDVRWEAPRLEDLARRSARWLADLGFSQE